jgi:dTDP-4-amino-4,6-dideoxygalactose transaminase
MNTDKISIDIPYMRPVFPQIDEWRDYLEIAYHAKQFTNGGPCVRILERRIEGWNDCHAKMAIHFGLASENEWDLADVVMTASGTAGLLAALQAVATNHQRLVILPAFTFPATAHAIELAGGIPVFCEIDPATGELDPTKLARLVAKHHLALRAIVHVRAFGMCRDLTPVVDVAWRYRVPLVVDAAAAFGGLLPNRLPVAAQGDIVVFSTHATKPFVTGEGGMVCANPTISARVRRAINFGMDDGEAVAPGNNGKMSEFHAAVGIAALDKLPQHLPHRRRVAARYIEAFGLSDRTGSDVGFPPWQTFPVRVSDARATQKRLLQAGIETRRSYYPAIHRGYFFRSDRLPQTQHLAHHTLCLPVYADMTDAEQDRVIAAMLEEPQNIS